MLRLTPLLLVAVLILSGCRESLLGPEPPAPDPVTDPTVPTQGLAPLYVKGPSELRNGEPVAYRAEPLFHPELGHYEWRVLGVGQFSLTTTDPTGQGRLIQARPTRPGQTLLIARAYARDGRLIAYGEKIVTID